MKPARRAEASGGGLSSLRQAWIEIDLDALEGNLRRLRRSFGDPSLRVIAVVKADAYGHGAVEVTRALEGAGVEMAAVALVEEGIELREAGLGLPILVLGPAGRNQLPLFAQHRLTPVVSALAELEAWRDWAAQSRDRAADKAAPVAIHLKIDTGMTRLGILPDEGAAALSTIRASPHLTLAGLMSHFAEADLPRSPVNAGQEARFEEIIALLAPDEKSEVLLHFANSAAALHRPASRHGAVRLGLALYGYDPAEERGQTAEPGVVDLEPVLTVRARIVAVKGVPAGTRVGYGGSWTAPVPSRIAILPLGYGDGLPRGLSHSLQVLWKGRRLPGAGVLSMDLTAVDATGTDAGVGDPVVLLGRDGGEEITARDLAANAGTVSYEILCGLGLRLPRRFVRRGGADRDHGGEGR